MKHDVIGTTEYVSLPELNGEVFPAKIDTGADSSAIWASEIEQNDGVLEYTFFAPGSAYYTGKLHQTRRFKVTSVRNSFGHEEIRYKVYLKVKIGKHTISRWFSLADRSRNNYPILLGKNFLKDRFIVDVAQNNLQSTQKTSKKVLVITSHPDEMNEFLTQVQQKNEQPVEYISAQFENLLFDINGRSTCIINTTDNDAQVSDYSLSYIKSHWRYPEHASALAEYLIYRNRPFFDQELRSYTSRSKLSELVKLSLHDLPIPRSFAAYPQLLTERFDIIFEAIGLPLVLKSAVADRGKDNFLVRDKKTFNEILGKANSETLYIAQAFVENEGFYRINVFGKEARLTIFRSSYDHKDPLKQHLNKPNGGVNATKLAPDAVAADIAELAVRAALCMERQIAGVDMLQDKISKEWYILEVNNSPQLRSGSHIEDKVTEFARFIDKELGR